MLDKFKKQWETLGKEDPYWAVLSDPQKKGGKWSEEEFFATGYEEIENLFVRTSQLGLEPSRCVALDYGCGVGRLSRALSGSFENVIGVDVSQAMLAEAQSVNQGYDNIQFFQNDGKSLNNIQDGIVDFIYCNLVLQHSPRTVQASIIKEFCRVLRPKGVLVFQTASTQNRKTIGGLAHYCFGNLADKLVTRIQHGGKYIMEMHTIKKQEVIKILEENKMQLVEVEKSDCAGRAFISHRYYAIKMV